MNGAGKRYCLHNRGGDGLATLVFGYYDIFLYKSVLTKRKHYAKIGISTCEGDCFLASPRVKGGDII